MGSTGGLMAASPRCVGGRTVMLLRGMPPVSTSLGKLQVCESSLTAPSTGVSALPLHGLPLSGLSLASHYGRGTCCGRRQQQAGRWQCYSG